MRIISGKFKSIKITPPKIKSVRPTTDRAKEGLFNIIENKFYFHGKTALDLFCGYGNIGLEFSSRGIDHITFVDHNPNCVNFIKKISEELNINSTTIYSESLNFLVNCKQKYDFIFADPPYRFNNHQKIYNIIKENNILTSEGILIIEHDKKTFFSNKNYEQRKYGNVYFSIFNL